MPLAHMPFAVRPVTGSVCVHGAGLGASTDGRVNIPACVLLADGPYLMYLAEKKNEKKTSISLPASKN